MKIAFDVQGTLSASGKRGDKVREFFNWLKDQGHDVIIWSNSHGYAKDMAQKLNHNKFQTK